LMHFSQQKKIFKFAAKIKWFSFVVSQERILLLDRSSFTKGYFFLLDIVVLFAKED